MSIRHKNKLIVGSYSLQSIYDVSHPVGEVIITFSEPVVPSGVTATWTDISASYEGKALWVDSTETAGTALDGSLPTPSIVSNGAHTHTAASAGGHTHSRGTMNITGSFQTVKYNRGETVCNGAFSTNGTIFSSWNTAEESYQSKGIRYDLNAANNWTGNTSSNGAHTHTAQSAGAHTHSVDTTGVYGASAGTDVVRPTSVVVKVYERTA